jgi:methylmalonyl-CoA mutase cobalamin-binding subunit
LPEEIEDIMSYGIDRIYSPDDGRELGLQGMIDDLVQNQILQQEKMSMSKIWIPSVLKILQALQNHFCC